MIKCYEHMKQSSSLMSFLSQILKFSFDKQTKWDKVVNQAEKVVGYPTSYLNLRWLLSEEFADVAVHLKKLLGTKHPLLKTARNLVLCKNVPTWGLVVLLISKVAGLKHSFPPVEKDISSGILYKQRVLAEITEMLRASNLVHKGILNLKPDLQNFPDVNFGNKIALLSGDYLLSTSFRALSSLRNQDITELMSAALRDLTQCEFIGVTDEQNKPIPSKPLGVQEDVDIEDPFNGDPYKIEGVLGNVKAEWTLRHILQGGSLLAKSCYCALLLGGHSSDVLKNGYLFGKHLALSWQAQFDLQEFYNEENKKFSPISAPVMLHLKNDSSFFNDFFKNLTNIDLLDYKSMRKRIMSGPALMLTEKMQDEHCKEALKYVYKFEHSDARNTLIDITSAVKDM